jgi:hypothetical protein
LKLGPWRFCFGEIEDSKLYHVWIGRVESEVVKDEQSDNFRDVHIQTSMVGAIEKRSNYIRIFE